MTTAAQLRKTQRWFLDRVGHRAGLRARPARSVVLPSSTLTPDERMHIYESMYLARLEECLSNDFPATRALLGDRRFWSVADAYVAAHPPSSWTLNDLGAKFPAFLAKRSGLPREALVQDVARLERAMSESFDAADAAPLTPEDVAKLPATAWAGARLVPAPSLRVLELATQANRAVVSIREKDKVPGRLPRGPSWVAVWRKDLRVWRLELTRPMHAALASLIRGGTLSKAVSAAARADDGDPSDLDARIRRAFATWISEGLFAGLRER